VKISGQRKYVPKSNGNWLPRSHRFLETSLIICPIAIAYSMGQIIKSVCLCLCVCVCVSVHLRALSWSHFLIDFHQNWHRRKNPKSKNEFVGGQYHTTPSPIFPPKTPFYAKRSCKPMQILSNNNNNNIRICIAPWVVTSEALKSTPISALNARKSTKFSRHLGNRGRGTRRWRQILDRKWKYGRLSQNKACF